MSLNWRSLSNYFPHKMYHSYQAQMRLTEAYKRLFQGSPSREDQEIVLADLKAKTGFVQVTPPSASNEELRYNEGRRSAFGEIFSHLSLNPSDLEALENAARREAALQANAEQ